MALPTITELAALLGCDATVVRGVAVGLGIGGPDGSPLSSEDLTSIEGELLATAECERGLLPPTGDDLRVLIDASALMEPGAEGIVRERLVPLARRGGTRLVVPLAVNSELIRYTGDIRPNAPTRASGTRALILLNALRREGVAELAGTAETGTFPRVLAQFGSGQRLLLITQQAELAATASGPTSEASRFESGLVVPWRPVPRPAARRTPAPPPVPPASFVSPFVAVPPAAGASAPTPPIPATPAVVRPAAAPSAPSPGGVPKTLCQGRYRVQSLLGGGQHSAVFQ